MWWTHQWRLPLLFLIAGIGVRFSLKKRNIWQFFGERFIRLFIPLVFAIFLITPIQVYFEWLQSGKLQPGYLEFYPSVFEIIPYPEGSFTWSHMWFVAYLFVFTLLLLPIFSLSKLPQQEKIRAHIDHFLNRIWTPLLPTLIFAGLIWVLYLDWPEQGSLIDDWYVFCSYLCFYLLGFLLSGYSSFWQSCLNFRKVYTALAVLFSLFMMYQYFWNWHEFKPQNQDLNMVVFSIANGFHIWCVLLALIGNTMKYLNFSNPTLLYLNQAVYPYYILHQAVIVSSGYYILQGNLPIWKSFSLLVLSCCVAIGVLYHFAIRKFQLSRVLFGMKRKA